MEVVTDEVHGEVHHDPEDGPELTDDELNLAFDGQAWYPEEEPFEEFLDVSPGAEAKHVTPFIYPSQFTQFAFRMHRPDGLGYENFSFEGRRHMLRPYDTPSNRILLFCGRQVEKCGNLTSSITLANGMLVKASDVRVGQRVICLDVLHNNGTKFTTSVVTWVSAIQQKKGVCIRTRQGHELEVATTHPIRVWDRWLDAGSIKVGTRVAAVRRAGDFGTSDMDPRRVELTAFMLGDGGLTQPTYNFTGIDGLVVDRFRTLVTSLGHTFREDKRSGNLILHIHKNGPLYDWMRQDNCDGKYSYEKELPAWVFDLDREQTALFLNRLWSTDGHVKKCTKSKYSIEYCSTSRVLARQVQALLWKFGIPTNIRENQPSYICTNGDPARLAYILRVETCGGIRNFLSGIGALGKSEGIQPPDGVENNNRDTYPIEINELLREIVASNPRPRSGSNAKEGSLRSAGLRETLKYPPTVSKLCEYLDFFQKDAAYNQDLVRKLSTYVDSDVYWDEVESIEERDLQCVDFEVADHHNFLIDGVVTHNSTLIGNILITYCCMVGGYKALYVSPSATQTKTFSNDRVKEPIETSPVLKSYTTQMLSQNIFEKQFANRSKITLRSAFLNADRTRGIPAWCLGLDELQDMLADNIPVIEQCTSHAPPNFRRFLYSGTPKGLDNPLEYYRSGVAKDGRSLSTQGEWVVPCDRCGSSAGSGRYWNILGEKNIGKKGLSCEKCGELINSMHEDAQWAFMTDDAVFESYRIPQLMVPWRPWDEILLDYSRYSRDRFYNEVLGLSYDSGMRPLTMAQVRACCNNDITMHPTRLEEIRKSISGRNFFAGVDWGCHDDQTRILTESGFKYFKDLTDADKVAQWDPETRAMSFVVPMARTVRDWDKPLLHFKTKAGLDLMVTDTHRMHVSVAGADTWVTESAGEQTAHRGGNVNFVGHVNWVGEERQDFLLPGIPTSSGYSGSEDRKFAMDDWVELLGYLITEGGLCFDGDRPSCLKMSQRETVNYETTQNIRSCLDRMNIPHSTFPNKNTGDINWTIYGKQFWSWYASNVGEACELKRIPREFLGLDNRQLRILFQALVAGDGYTDPREGCTGGAFYSTSKGLCEDFQELCIRIGLRCIVRLHKPAEGNRQTRWRAMWSEGRDYHVTTPKTSVVKVPYSGKVYCCAVPSGYIVTERNGCISYQGNTGENSYTVLTLGYYENKTFRIFFIHRFIGEDTDPEIQLKKIISICRAYNVRLIGTDYGGGFVQNNTLFREFGLQRVHKFQYMSRCKKKVFWDPRLRRWAVHRTEVMSDVFNAIKRRQIEFPRWEEFRDPYGQDMLNIFSEYNNMLRMIQYQHRPDHPDDAFHSVLYCFLASMIIHPRPDIIVPKREYDGQGPVLSSYSGPINQG